MNGVMNTVSQTFTSVSIPCIAISASTGIVFHFNPNSTLYMHVILALLHAFQEEYSPVKHYEEQNHFLEVGALHG